MIPTHCPICQVELVSNGPFYKCPGSLYQLKHQVTHQAHFFEFQAYQDLSSIWGMTFHLQGYRVSYWPCLTSQPFATIRPMTGRINEYLFKGYPQFNWDITTNVENIRRKLRLWSILD